MHGPPVLRGLAERTAPVRSRLVSTCAAVAVWRKRDSRFEELDQSPVTEVSGTSVIEEVLAHDPPRFRFRNRRSRRDHSAVSKDTLEFDIYDV